MPDISMCTGTGCPLKETCYRHTAQPNERGQSWFGNPPIVAGKCDHYWKVGE
jgi:hypothetical protein